MPLHPVCDTCFLLPLKVGRFKYFLFLILIETMNEVTEKKSRGIDISDISRARSVSVVHTSASIYDRSQTIQLSVG